MNAKTQPCSCAVYDDALLPAAVIACPAMFPWAVAADSDVVSLLQQTVSWEKVLGIIMLYIPPCDSCIGTLTVSVAVAPLTSANAGNSTLANLIRCC